ncbi:MAG TPA: transferase [Acidimicrobiia bacterium]
MVIDETAIIGADVSFGRNPRVGPLVVIGVDLPDAGPVVFGDDCIVRSHSVIYGATTFGDRCAVGHHALIREETTVGSDVSVGSFTSLGPSVRVGDRVRFHTNCFVPEESVIEDGAWFGPGVVVTNARYPNRPDTKQNLEGVHVERDAVIGAAVVLLPGVRIGAGALIGAGAVVTKDVAPGATVIGNPGRMVAQ